MTLTQKAMRGIVATECAKDKVYRRMETRPGYREKFVAKHHRNLEAARLRVIARREAAKKADQ